MSDGSELRPAALQWPFPPARSYTLLGCVVFGYIGVYLCRKNISVAVPLIQKAFGVTKAQTGDIISYSATAYALGKLLFGPIIDKLGGRLCLFAVMAGVAIFGGLGACAVSLPMLVFCYAANRLCGSGGWGSIIKQTPAWFPAQRLSFAVALLSLSYVFGGVCALVLAGTVAKVSNDNWRMVMGFPSVVLLVMLWICWRILPPDKPKISPQSGALNEGGFRFSYLLRLAKLPQLWVVCGLAFALYIMRETFNDWTVDFFKTESGGQMSSQVSALLSTPFDAAGAVGIILMGWILDRITGIRRTVLVAGTLAVLSALIYFLPQIYRLGLAPVEIAIGLIGFLSYGPYSLLAGVWAVEVGGAKGVGTVAGTVDSAGYVGAICAGHWFGELLDHGGYALGFHVLGMVTLVAALLSLALSHRNREVDFS